MLLWRIIQTLVFLFLTLPVQAYQPAVVSAHEEASRVGIDVLKRGGSAADAAVATAFALTVVEPYNSGIGGGGFLLYYEAKTGKFYFVDYREVAPLALNRRVYRKDPNAIDRGVYSVGVPGFLLGMETIHKRWRRLSWPSLIEPAIELAGKGLPTRGLLKEKLISSRGRTDHDPEMIRIYYDPLTKSDRIDLSDLARTLENIKTGGADVFYSGELGGQLTRLMKKSRGWITARDLKSYRVHFREPYQFNYRDFAIASAPLPSSGGKGLHFLFKRSIVTKLEEESPFSSRAFDQIIESFERYFDYRNVALGDTPTNVVGHTTHICVIDEEGNMASMTNTLNYPFGAGIIVPRTGIILNNELGDFSLKRHTANRPTGGRRPLSSMSPSVVFRNGEPHLIIGTPGGTTIPQNIFQVLFFYWNWEDKLTYAIRQPKVYYSPKKGEIIAEKKLHKRVRRDLESKYGIDYHDGIGNVQALEIKTQRRTNIYTDKRGQGGGFVMKYPYHYSGN